MGLAVTLRQAAKETAPTSQYRIYGLCIRSDTKLIGLNQCNGDLCVDVSIQQHSDLPVAHSPDKRFFRTIQLDDGSVHMHAAEVCEARIAPQQGLIEWQAGSHDYPEAAQAYLLGAGLSYCLLARGVEPVHGTALLVDGEAIVLLGDSGYGKSTLAAGFVAAGHSVITDDMLVLERRGKNWLVQPGIARIKLFPEVRDALLPGPAGVPMNPFTTKEVVYLEQRVTTPVPLKAMYLLPRTVAQAQQVRIRSASPRTAFFSLIRNTFNDAVANSSRLKIQFDFAREVSATVPVRALRYPKSLDRVGEVVRRIISDASSL